MAASWIYSDLNRASVCWYARYVAVSLLVYLTENKSQTLASNCVVTGIILIVQNGAERLDSFPQLF